MMFLIPGNGPSVPCTLCTWMRLVMDTTAEAIAGSACNASRTRALIASIAPAAG